MPFRYQPQVKIDRIARKAFEAARASARPFTELSQARHEAATPGLWALRVWFDTAFDHAPQCSVLSDGYFEDTLAVYETLCAQLDTRTFNQLMDLERSGLSVPDAIAWARAQLIHQLRS